MSIIIENGTHTGPSLGVIPGPDGTLVQVWGLDNFALSVAMLAAIGPIPHPAEFGMGGSVVMTPWDPEGGTPPQLMYNPAGDVINTTKGSEYDSLIKAWNERAECIKDAINNMRPK